MQEKTILVPEIVEIPNFNNLLKQICPVCETWHLCSKKRCIFCQKHNFKKKNTLVISFKPLISKNKDAKILIINFLLIANKFKNVYFNVNNLNFYFYISENYDQKYDQYFDLFLDDVYKVFIWDKLSLNNFKSKYMNAYLLFVKNRKRPFEKRILMPLFECKTPRRKIINNNIETFF